MERNARLITVIVADDHEVVREGVQQMLASAHDIMVVGVAEDGVIAQKMVSALHPHVLILDLVMPGPSAAEIALWVQRYHPETAVLVLTAHDRDYYLAQMLDAGAAGYLDKGARAQQLIRAIRAAAAGQMLFTLDQQRRARAWQVDVQALWVSLTPREQEVLRLLAKGLGNRDIAMQLKIAEKTVEKHTSEVLGKLRVASRTEAALWMANSGLEEC